MAYSVPLKSSCCPWGAQSFHELMDGWKKNEFDARPTERLRTALYPIEIPKDYAAQKKVTDAIVAFWQHLSPFLRKAQEAGSWKEEAFVVEAVNGEVDDPPLLRRAAQHEEWLRKSDD